MGISCNIVMNNGITEVRILILRMVANIIASSVPKQMGRSNYFKQERYHTIFKTATNIC